MMQQGVDVNLPQVVATELPADTDLLIVSVDRSGNVFVGKTRVALDSLAVKLRALYSRKSGKEAYLRADKDVPYGVVVEVMAAMKHLLATSTTRKAWQAGAGFPESRMACVAQPLTRSPRSVMPAGICSGHVMGRVAGKCLPGESSGASFSGRRDTGAQLVPSRCWLLIFRGHIVRDRWCWMELPE